jgi:hypothetical protein
MRHNNLLNTVKYVLKSRVQIFRAPGAMTTKFCMVAPNVNGSSVWNLLYVTLLASRIFRWPLEVSKICTPLTEAIP